jgi:hypothetical protein
MRIAPKFGGLPQEAEGPFDTRRIQSSTTREPIPAVHTPEDWIIEQLDGRDDEANVGFTAEKLIKKHLDKRTASIVIMHLLQGMSFRQMVKVVGGHPSGLWVSYHKGLKHLKPHLQKFIKEDN